MGRVGGIGGGGAWGRAENAVLMNAIWQRFGERGFEELKRRGFDLEKKFFKINVWFYRVFVYMCLIPKTFFPKKWPTCFEEVFLQSRASLEKFFFKLVLGEFEEAFLQRGDSECLVGLGFEPFPPFLVSNPPYAQPSSYETPI